MKKFYILGFNVLAILIVYFGFEYYLFLNEKDDKPFFYNVKSYYSAPFPKHYKTGSINFRNPVFGNKNLKPVVLFICSFAFGDDLTDEATFQYKLSKLTNRTVYNRAVNGWGLQHMLYLLKSDDLYKEMPEPEYVIYLYISNHIERMYKYTHGEAMNGAYHYLKYHKIFNNLIRENRLQNMLYSRVWNKIILHKTTQLLINNQAGAFNLFEKHLLECKKEMKKHWKNTKFIIFDYESPDNFFNLYPDNLNPANVKKLENDGFIVIKTSDLTNIKLGDEYYLTDINHHPNEKAWDLVTPLFAEKLKTIF